MKINAYLHLVSTLLDSSANFKRDSKKFHSHEFLTLFHDPWHRETILKADGLINYNVERN
jgi:hypothetical protein